MWNKTFDGFCDLQKLVTYQSSTNCFAQSFYHSLIDLISEYEWVKERHTSGKGTNPHAPNGILYKAANFNQLPIQERVSAQILIE